MPTIFYHIITLWRSEMPSWLLVYHFRVIFSTLKGQISPNVILSQDGNKAFPQDIWSLSLKGHRRSIPANAGYFAQVEKEETRHQFHGIMSWTFTASYLSGPLRQLTRIHIGPSGHHIGNLLILLLQLLAQAQDRPSSILRSSYILTAV